MPALNSSSMEVKALPSQVRNDSRPTHSDQARFLEAEAGNRTQSEGACIAHTGVRGVPRMKQSLEKRPTPKQGYT